MTDDNSLMVLVVFAFIVIAILGGIIVKQRQTINDFKQPKYGFLGKKLSVYLLGVFTFAIGSFILYPSDRQIDTSISVSESQPTIKLEIIYNLISEADKTYEFTLIPTINGVEWEDEISNFEVLWQINDESFSEFVSKENPGGFLARLDSGKNKIIVSITYKDLTYVETLEIDI